MKQRFAWTLLIALVVALWTPMVLAQSTGSVKGVARDPEGKPITAGTVEWMSMETGRKYTLKLNKKGEYFSLGITPGKYKVTLFDADGKQVFYMTGINVGLDELTQDIDLKKEAAAAAQGQGLTPEQLKAQQEAQAKAQKENMTVKTLNEKLLAAKTASDAGDFDSAIATLSEATQVDANRDLLWFKLGDAYRMSAPKQTDPAEKQKRFAQAADAYQKAIDLKTANPDPKDAEANQKLAAYYNNLAEADAKSNKIDDAVTNYNKAAQLDPARAGQYNFNIGAVLTNAGKVDDAIVAFDKVIAVDPTKADAYYWKGVNMIGKATLKGDKMVAPDGTAEAFNKYLELAPTGNYAQPAKDMLASIGASVETGFNKKKATATKK
ncbi:MAG TPA: tetratricopeptide repeat protein [Terriglobales bacterium]|nr:tetratricopeptide repeat protein [Terriglobales bacterium]